MISEKVIEKLAAQAEWMHAGASNVRGLPAMDMFAAAEHMHAQWVREADEQDATANSYDLLAEVARLLNSDARLRDALGEARDRAAGALSGIQVVNLAAAELCAECGDLTLVLVDGSPVCEPCFDVANAVNLVPVEPDADFLMLGALLNGTPADEGADEPDLAPSDAQDDEAGEVTL